jgi:hypothetical protein
MSMNNNINTRSPAFYDKKINELNQRFYLVLDELKKSYPTYKVYPDNPEYENIYSNNISNMEKTNMDIFSLKQQIDKDSIKINKIIKQKNIDITRKKNENEELKKELESLMNGANSSTGMIGQKQSIYNMELFNLVIVVLSVLGISVLTYKK